MSAIRAARGRGLLDGFGFVALVVAVLFGAIPLHSAVAEDAAPAAESAQPAPAAASDSGQSPAATQSQDSAPAGSSSEQSPAAAQTSPPEASPAATSAPAQESAPAPAPPSPEASAPVSTSVVVNLIRLLVQEGVLTQAKADALIRQAQDEAVAAAAKAEAAAAPAPSAAPTVGTAPATATDAGESGAAATGWAAAAAAGEAPAAAATAEAPANALPKAPPSVRVQYVPEIVKKQIEEQVKQQVMQQAKDEHWAEPNALPEWTKRITLSGDFRARYEWDLFDKRNDPNFTNFAAFNAGNPFDIASISGPNNVFPPVLNTTQDRQRMRIRARLGLTADITDDFTAGIRLATGNTTNPVSTNQTLGTTLNNDNFVLDRAYLKYGPAPWLTFYVGRFEDPWFHTDLVWDPDVNFDGIVAEYTPHPNGVVRPFLTAGVFPIENTPFNFPDNTTFKQPSRDKWLYGAQAGFEYHPRPEYNLKAGLAYYYFQNLQGNISDPCVATTAATPCDTDNSKPGFMQQGNTVFFIRNLVLTGVNPPQFQFVGLASSFKELNGTFEFDYAKYDPLHLILDADFVTNLGFNKSAIAAKTIQNNLDANNQFAGGANGFQTTFTVGHPRLVERWDWNVSMAYKYLESDAVVDAFTDSDFHLGGTNAKGYIFGGGLGLARNIDLSARWLSASEISGPPYTVDVIQVDLNGHF